MSGAKITIRSASGLDLEPIREILLEAYSQYSEVMPPERWKEYRESIEQSVYSPAIKEKLVATIDEKIIGSIFVFTSSETAYGNAALGIHTPIVRLLAVSPEVRGKGVATELLRASARLALEWGADTLHLHTSDLMDAAIRLYERLGFERDEDKEFYNGEILVKSYRLLLKEAALLHT